MRDKKGEVAYYDLETSKWDIFVVGGVASDRDGYRQYDDSDALFSYLLSFDTVYAHNGGRFDHKAFLDWAKRNAKKAQVYSAGSRIIRLKCGKTTFLDSKAIAPLSLERLTATQGVSKQKLALPCDCGKDCGGYCAITPTMPRDQFERLCTYLRADCESLKEAMERLDASVRAVGLTEGLAGTLGATGWRFVKRTLGSAEFSGYDYRALREGYYGGRTQLFRESAPEGIEIDVVSMYPSIMQSEQLPYGPFEVLTRREAANALVDAKPGIYNVDVSVPEMYAPPVPFRGDNRLFFPTGEFSATLALPEILEAMRCGVEITRVNRAHVFDATTTLADFVNLCFAQRKAAGKETPLGEYWKWVMNSVSGKLAARPEKRRYILDDDFFEMCSCSIETEQEFGHCTCGAAEEIHDGIWRKSYFKIDDCAHIGAAAYITAHARAKLNRAIQANESRILYCDTDSVFLSGLHAPIGIALSDTLGAFELKTPFTRFEAIAPKVYSYVLPDGSVKCRAKGVAIPKGEQPEIGKVYTRESIRGFPTGARKGEFFKADVSTRVLRRRYGGRISTGDGNTRAPTIEEVIAWQK